MAFDTVTVTTSASEIISANTARQSVIIANTDTSKIIYIGQDNTVTTSNGIPIVPNGNFTDSNDGGRMYKGPYFAIVGSGTVDARYWERTQSL